MQHFKPVQQKPTNLDEGEITWPKNTTDAEKNENNEDEGPFTILIELLPE